MTRAAATAALIMVLLGLAAVVLAPAASGPLTRIRPAELWGGREGSAPAGAAPAGGAPAALPSALPTVHVVEQVSPIVGPESTLVESLGFEMHEKLTTVLPKGAPVPVRRIVTFRTSGDDQKEIRLHVMRGQSEIAAQDRSLGWVRVGGLPAGPRGSVKVAVMFEVADGAIVMTAVDPANGRVYPIEPSEAPPGMQP